MTKTYEQARDEAAAGYIEKSSRSCEEVGYGTPDSLWQDWAANAYISGADFGRNWERKRSEKLVEALKELAEMKPYRCWTCDGGERYQDIAKDAFAEYEELEKLK